MGKWCLHASSFIFDRIIIKVAGNQDRHKSSDDLDFGPLVSMVHLCFLKREDVTFGLCIIKRSVFFFFFFFFFFFQYLFDWPSLM